MKSGFERARRRQGPGRTHWVWLLVILPVMVVGEEVVVPPDLRAVGGDLFVHAGTVGQLMVDVTGDGLRYAWFRRGLDAEVEEPLGVDQPRLVFDPVRAHHAGDYRVVVTNSAGEVRAGPFKVRVRATLINLSTRARVGAGQGSSVGNMIAGFVLSGPRDLLLRGIGDGLRRFGIGDPLEDPQLLLYGPANLVVARNDDGAPGGEASSAAAAVGAFPLAPRDAALVHPASGGPHTAFIEGSGFSDDRGVALVEVYALGRGRGRLLNVSTRAFVGRGDAVVIAGFVVEGSQPGRFLLRGVGPALAGFGVPDPLQDPVLRVFRGATDVAANDDWWRSPVDTEGAADRVGAFPLPGGSRDAALLLDLEPGGYTVVLTGAGESEGNALVEIYEAPP